MRHAGRGYALRGAPGYGEWDGAPTNANCLFLVAGPLASLSLLLDGFVPPPLGRSWTTRSEIAIGDALLLELASSNPATQTVGSRGAAGFSWP